MLSKAGGDDLPEYLVKCSKCGKTYVARVNREGLCNDCKAQNTAISKRVYYEKRKFNGGNLKSELPFRKCKECGKRFNASGSQTICRMCSRKMSIKKNNDHRNSTTSSLSLRLPKYIHEEMKQIASDKRISLTSLVLHSYDIYKRLLDLPPEEQDSLIAMLPSAVDRNDKKDD